MPNVTNLHTRVAIDGVPINATGINCTINSTGEGYVTVLSEGETSNVQAKVRHEH